MAAPLEQSNIAERTRLLTLLALLEAILLYITQALHDQRNRIYYDADDICRFAKTGLAILEHIRTVQDGNR